MLPTGFEKWSISKASISIIQFLSLLLFVVAPTPPRRSSTTTSSQDSIRKNYELHQRWLAENPSPHSSTHETTSQHSPPHGQPSPNLQSHFSTDSSAGPSSPHGPPHGQHPPNLQSHFSTDSSAGQSSPHSPSHGQHPPPNMGSHFSPYSSVASSSHHTSGGASSGTSHHSSGVVPLITEQDHRTQMLQHAEDQLSGRSPTNVVHNVAAGYPGGTLGLHHSAATAQQQRSGGLGRCDNPAHHGRHAQDAACQNFRYGNV